MEKYLVSSTYINWDDPSVGELARSLSSGIPSEEERARKCFEWVRDNIRHSVDFQLNPVTCRASDVLKYKTGYCYAKSHLLAALLRASGLPAGLCYQRLSVHGDGPPYCLHGLNAVFLQKYGWYRIDARGNKKNVDARFHPPREQLAFSIRSKFEADLPEIRPEPMPVVVAVLERYETWREVYDNLPDIELISS